MTQEIKYSGFTATPSDYECPDGELALSFGVVNEDGALKPVLSPKEVTELDEGETVCLIHTTSAFTHYIVYNATGGTISYIDKDTMQKYGIGTGLAGITRFDAIGNVLMAFAQTSITYYLWKENAYSKLGNHIPDIDISFGLQGHPKFYSLSYNDGDTFPISFDKIDKKDIYEEFSDENKASITNQVLAKVNKFVADETTDKGRFCMPFFVRYALKLYDGSYVNHSAPILMIPATTSAPVVLWKRVSGKESYTDADLDIMLVACDLDYLAVCTTGFYQLDDWSDIISSIDVFVSAPIYTYDQSGEVSSFHDTDNMDSVFVGKLCVKDIRVPSTLLTTEDTLCGGYASTEFLNWYAEWKYSRLYDMYYSGDGTYPATTLGLPEFTGDSLRETIEDTATFYKLCSITIGELQEATSERKVITIAEDYLQSLLTRETLDDDYLTHDTLSANYSFCYNQRVNLSGVARGLFNGFPAQAMFPYKQYLVSVKVEETTDERGGTSIDYYLHTVTNYPLAVGNMRIDVYIKENGNNYKVYNEYSYVSLPPFLSQKYEEGGLSECSWPLYVFYPNTNAKKMVVHDYDGSMYCIELKAHDFLNGAFALLDWGTTRESNMDSAGLPSTIQAENRVPVPNKVYTSEVDNPFYFPLSGINTVGTGTILGICSAAKALSQGQFGQFPLYAFSTDGVWALEVSDTGTYSAKQPFTRDVCINPDSITQIDSAVLFATARGIMLVSGSEAVCLTDSINSSTPFTVQDLPEADKLLQVFNDNAGGDGQVQMEDVAILPFLDFLQECRMIYDYTNQHIIVYNPSARYAYVYSLKSKEWGMMHSGISDNVNSYPDALAMQGTELVNLSASDATGVTALVVTRPFKLGSPDVLKTIDTIVQRGYFRKGHVSQVLYGSRDLFNWHIVWSSTDHYLRGFRGTPYKYFRIALVCRLDKNDSIYGCTAQFTPRFTNKPR